MAGEGSARAAGRRLGVGIVGNGMATRVFHAPYIAACDALELRAVVARSEGAQPPLPGVALVRDAEALIADPAIDLVVIATPSASHAALATRALEAGKHVVVEKPFALDLAETRALIALAHERTRVLTAFHNRRRDADFLGVRAAIEEGQVGRVVHFESHFDRFRPHVRERWREDGSAGSGIWYDLGPHLVDQALVLFGAPESVDADIAALRDDGRASDWAHVVLRYAQMRVVLHAGMCVAGGEPRFRVHGTGGSLVKFGLDPQEGQSVAGLRPGAREWGLDGEALHLYAGEGEHREIALPRGSQEHFYAQVAQACLGEAQPAVATREIELVQAVIEAAMLSSAQGRRVTLAEVLGA